VVRVGQRLHPLSRLVSPGRRALAHLLLAAALVLTGALPAAADRLEARIHLSSQTMMVFHEGRLVYHWPVSTARAGKVTPLGTFTAQWLSRHHKSSRYNNAPMPFSIFFHGHYAIHGTDQISRLGEPASAGCIRLHPENAAVLFELARREGLDNTRIVISR